MKFKELLFNIFSDHNNANLLAYINNLDNQYLAPLWHIMESNFMFNLSISEFARMAGRSVSTFKREFFDYYRTTPGKWLTAKRLEHARVLLSSSNKSISAIADDSGFENLTHFSRIFKEKYGSSPFNYRKLFRTSFAG